MQGDAVGFWATFWAMLADIWAVFQGSERKALIMTLWLAFFDQGMASTAIINYAPQILTAAGVESHGAATLYSSAITAAKVSAHYQTLKDCKFLQEGVKYRRQISFFSIRKTAICHSIFVMVGSIRKWNMSR